MSVSASLCVCVCVCLCLSVCLCVCVSVCLCLCHHDVKPGGHAWLPGIAAFLEGQAKKEIPSHYRRAGQLGLGNTKCRINNARSEETPNLPKTRLNRVVGGKTLRIHKNTIDDFIVDGCEIRSHYLRNHSWNQFVLVFTLVFALGESNQNQRFGTVARTAFATSTSDHASSPRSLWLKVRNTSDTVGCGRLFGSFPRIIQNWDKPRPEIHWLRTETQLRPKFAHPKLLKPRFTNFGVLLLSSQNPKPSSKSPSRELPIWLPIQSRRLCDAASCPARTAASGAAAPLIDLFPSVEVLPFLSEA